MEAPIEVFEILTAVFIHTESGTVNPTDGAAGNTAPQESALKAAQVGFA